jgi:TPR repeat protein
MNDDSAAVAHIVGPLLVAVLVFSIVTAVFADRDDAAAALRRGDFPAALAAFQPLAEAGDAASQFDLGVLYQHGWGTSRDTATAIAWYTKAAKQGHFLVQHNLGVIYFYGRGIPQNDVKA